MALPDGIHHCASSRRESGDVNCPPVQVVAILEAGRPLPFTVKAANLDLPELQGEPLEIAKEKCRLAAQQVRRPQSQPPLMSHALRRPASSETASGSEHAAVHAFSCLGNYSIDADIACKRARRLQQVAWQPQ